MKTSKRQTDTSTHFLSFNTCPGDYDLLWTQFKALQRPLEVGERSQKSIKGKAQARCLPSVPACTGGTEACSLQIRPQKGASKASKASKADTFESHRVCVMIISYFFMLLLLSGFMHKFYEEETPTEINLLIQIPSLEKLQPGRE